MRVLFPLQILLASIIAVLLTDSSVVAQTVAKLSPGEFEQKLQTTKNTQLVDVCTKEEFTQRHLRNALNADYKSPEFERLIAHLDKTKPTFVYCYSGGRSASATDMLKQKGFTQIYELKGGIRAWTNEDKPVEAAMKTDPNAGMTMAEFEKNVAGEMLTLVDFGANWCPPCKKMEPIMKKLVHHPPVKMRVLQLDVDQHPALAKAKGVEILPTLLLYKNGKLLWQKSGFMDEAALTQVIEKYSGTK